MLVHESIVDSCEGWLFREGNGQSPEMSLKTRVDLERTSCGIHTGQVLCVLDVFQCEFTSVVPMFVIFVLSQQCNSILCVIWIKFWHVEIINEVNELVFAHRCISSTSFLLK